MKAIIITFLVVFAWCTAVSGIGYEGWYRGKFVWNFEDETLSVESTFDTKLQWTDELRTIQDLYLDETGFNQLKLRGQWYRFPYRFKWTLNFDENGFDYENSEWKYRKDPWQVSWETELYAGEKFHWDIDGLYKVKQFSCELIPAFDDLLTFSSFTGKLSFPLLHDWQTKLAISVDPADNPAVSPEFSLAAPFENGTLTVDVIGGRLSEVDYDWELSSQTEDRTIYADWTADTGWECSYSYRYTFGQGRWQRFYVRLEEGSPITVTDFNWYITWNELELEIDFIDKELSFTVDRDLPNNLSIEIFASWGVEDDTQEIEGYLEGDNFYLDIDLSFTGGSPDEFTITGKFYF